ncbi:MAG: RDD family protein [Mediterranea sp.]|jgi:uncharacterized RDD family membrane protein YckC|nr:RDD family protein [Mediterranea sp.]
MAESTILTGQFVRIYQTPASLGERIIAWIIDAIFISIYIYGTVALLNRVYLRFNTFIVILLLGLYLPVLMYPFLCELFNRGRSLGKWLMHIRVVKVDGSTPGLGDYLLRWLLLLVDLVLTGGLGAIFILFTKNNQRLGDLAAGTMVIKEKNYKRIHVSLDEFYYLSDGYQPSYPQASDLSVEQANLIIRTLEISKEKMRRKLVFQLAQKVRHSLAIHSHYENEEEFLHTLLRDYQYYAQEEW